MKILIFCHPRFLSSQSMPRFAKMLETSFEALGHDVRTLAPKARFHKLFGRHRYAKWGGYIDQYVIFPKEVRRTVKAAPADTLFVFADQALGPWVPMLKKRPHVVHVHDLLNLRSALGHEPCYITSFSGRVYQRYIRRGFRQARHFISVSEKTREDLHKFGRVEAVTSDVVYNGLSFPYTPMLSEAAFEKLKSAGLPVGQRGMLLNLGGGQWYKNQQGLIALYAKYVANTLDPLPLWCISPQPRPAIALQIASIPAAGRVLFFQNLDHHTLRAAYSYAHAFLFPSFAEGFGWPLIEAQACGCPVITTDDAPMNEVAGPVARYIPRLPFGGDLDAWASLGADVLRELLALGPSERRQIAERGAEWAKRFDGAGAISQYLDIYRRVLGQETARR